MPLGNLFVRDFAIVRRLSLDLGPGLTVLTGETGAGKSIIVDALALVLGARAETDNIRHGADSAEVLGSFDLDLDEDSVQWLQAQELSDGSECIVRRIVYRDKPSRAFINGRPVTVQTLKQLGDLLVDIHGQHEHQSLLRKDSQRQVLDDFAGLHDKLALLEQHFIDYQQCVKRLDNLAQQADDRLARIDLLRYQSDELAKLEFSRGEYQTLEQEHGLLAHASELKEGMEYCVDSLYDAEEHPTTDVLAHCIQRLESLEPYAPDVVDTSSLLKEALIQVQEAATQLHHLLDKVEIDPKRLAWVEHRMSTAIELGKKHKCDPGELPVVLDGLTQELSHLEDNGATFEELEQQTSEYLRRYQVLAKEVSGDRIEAAERLQSAVTQQMQNLGMVGGILDIEVKQDTDEPTRFGFDRVEFQVSANPGQPVKPLAKVASGGELSRISLAIQVVTASIGRVPSLVFDEVDVGIGGSVAEIVGQKLRAIGAARQVLCITHLAQVASQGQQHLSVQKQADDGTLITITPLDDESRISEIARMLGGVKISERTRAHAADMLERATSD